MMKAVESSGYSSKDGCRCNWVYRIPTVSLLEQCNRICILRSCAICRVALADHGTRRHGSAISRTLTSAVASALLTLIITCGLSAYVPRNYDVIVLRSARHDTTQDECTYSYSRALETRVPRRQGWWRWCCSPRAAAADAGSRDWSLHLALVRCGVISYEQPCHNRCGPMQHHTARPPILAPLP